MNIAIILAGGSELALNLNSKQYFKIGNKSIINYTIDAFERSSLIDKIIIVVDKKYINEVSKKS